MSGIEVVVIVGSILAAFSNGMNLFKQMTAKKRKKQGNKEIVRLNDEEIVLHKSLKGRPTEIKAQYDRDVAQLGHLYAVGDSTAHTNLLSTLTVLNTGLLNLVNIALSQDPKARTASRVSLLSLSEKTAVDTLSALGDLNARLSAASRAVPNKPLKLKEPPQPHVQEKAIQKSSASSPKKKRPSPTPLLLQGGWGMPKSSSSITTVSKSRKPSQSSVSSHQRSKSSPALHQMTESEGPRPSLASRTPPLPLSVPSTPVSLDMEGLVTPPPQYSRSPPQQMWTYPGDRTARPERQPSMLLVPADFFKLEECALAGCQESPPPRPPKIPLRQPSVRMRHRPLSTRTFMTASTKIGEIPEDHWPDRQLTHSEQQRRQMPYVIPPPLMVPEVKKKGRGFRFWRKDAKEQSVAAF